MGLKSKIAEYREYKSGVKHCTFNPEGPGVVRIHLVPPKFRLLAKPSYILILNGYYMLPLGYSWALLLSSFISEVNRYDGLPMGEGDMENARRAAIKGTKAVYRQVPEECIREDLDYMLDVIFEVARGGKPDADIERLSMRKYARNMTAPHRMDLMVSAMTDGEGRWKCNQKCAFCYAAGQPLSAAKELTTEEWKSAIDKLRAAGVPMLTFTGGEPTLREDIAELIGYSKWFVTRLNTNGVGLDRELVAALKKASLDSVQVTLYSHDENIHNKLVGSEHFADTVAGIKNALDAGLDLSVNTPLCSLNKDYGKTLSMLSDMGVRFVTVSGLICTGGALDKHSALDLSEDEMYEILREAKDFTDKNGMEMDFTSPGLVGKERLEGLGLNLPACGACISNMAIAPDGTVIPCQSWLSEGSGLGNILTDSFTDIWNSKLSKDLKKISEEDSLVCPFRSKTGGQRSNG